MHEDGIAIFSRAVVGKADLYSAVKHEARFTTRFRSTNCTTVLTSPRPIPIKGYPTPPLPRRKEEGDVSEAKSKTYISRNESKVCHPSKPPMYQNQERKPETSLRCMLLWCLNHFDVPSMKARKGESTTYYHLQVASDEEKSKRTLKSHTIVLSKSSVNK